MVVRFQPRRQAAHHQGVGTRVHVEPLGAGKAPKKARFLACWDGWALVWEGGETEWQGAENQARTGR